MPGQYGIGTFGKEAFHFIDFLHASGQTYWQILPLGPTGFGNSPYQTFSTFAINPLFIDPEKLYEDGLLDKEDCFVFSIKSSSQLVEYERVYKNHFILLKKAYERFKKIEPSKFLKFISENEYWLSDYAKFMAIKIYFGNISSQDWPNNILQRDKESLENLLNKLSDEITFFKFLQFKAYTQWKEIKVYAESKNIKIIGDLPIYTGLDSSDIWSNPKIFLLDERLRPTFVAGCPPDDFSPNGQNWGSPLYNWQNAKNEVFSWWKDRLKYALKLFDIVRIDHFRGLDAYYAIPYNEKNAALGKWVKGPGLELFKFLNDILNQDSIIAEDLGFLDDSVKQLLKETGFPGMKILQFAFDGNPQNPYLPHNFAQNSVVYTGTHDNDTTKGWFKDLPIEQQKNVNEYCNIADVKNISWDLIKLAYSSVSRVAIIPMQDFLGLGSESRMNTPSTIGNNWVWRLDKNLLTPGLSEKIKNICTFYNRL